jgi:hypothetical protein
MVVRLARLVKVTVSGASGVQAWPMASAHRCRLPSAWRRVPRQAPSTDTIGRRVLATRPVRPSGCSRHWICQPLTGSRALICSRVAVAADRVGIGPVAAAGWLPSSAAAVSGRLW